MKILIIGFGVVGQNMQKIFPDAQIADPAKGYRVESTKKFDVAFVCVPTEMNEGGSCDTSIVESVIQDYGNQVEVFCIKSTVPPGTTLYLEKKYFNEVVFSPEYFGETVHANGHDYNFLILGGDRAFTKKAAEAYKQISHSNLKIIQTDSKTAELCKYMENCWLATKVTFCNEFKRIADNIDVDYNELRELWLMDPRINRSHTFVYEDQQYYSSHCLNKDIPALINFADRARHSPNLMKSVFDTNEIHKNEN